MLLIKILSWFLYLSPFLMVISFWIGKWQGEKKCMIEHHILFGKAADEFERRMKEAEKNSSTLRNLKKLDYEKQKKE